MASHNAQQRQSPACLRSDSEPVLTQLSPTCTPPRTPRRSRRPPACWQTSAGCRWRSAAPGSSGTALEWGPVAEGRKHLDIQKQTRRSAGHCGLRHAITRLTPMRLPTPPASSTRLTEPSGTVKASCRHSRRSRLSESSRDAGHPVKHANNDFHDFHKPTYCCGHRLRAAHEPLVRSPPACAVAAKLPDEVCQHQPPLGCARHRCRSGKHDQGLH